MDESVGDHPRITGHKWFFSAPQCDAHLVLAQTERGLSCFFIPRRLSTARGAAAISDRAWCE
jgi:putative acyl-CoA dehydrogenase